MASRTIRLCYRKVIDATASTPWDRLVFADSQAELRMQAQLYNPGQQYRTYAELLQAVPEAKQLPFLVSGAIVGYLQQLHDRVPDVQNNLGQLFLRFTQFQFEIIDADFTDKSQHQVAICFFSEPLFWHDTIGPYLLVSPAQPRETTVGETLTDLVQPQPFLSIYSLHEHA